jgi:8-oxo-dGTP pyrophosphatase MutT (NUDIX family)
MKFNLKASMVVILDDRERVLILKRSPGPHWMPEKWALVGGHVEEGESPRDAALREAKEETNLELRQVQELVQRQDVMIYYSNIYDGEVKIDFEHTDWVWASYDELDNYDITPKLKETVKLALDKLS